MISSRTDPAASLLAEYSSEAFLRLVADALPVALAYVDGGLRYRFRNRTHDEWYGRPGELGMTVSELLGEEMFRRFEPNMRRALAGESMTFPKSGLGPTEGRRFRVTYIPDAREGRVAGFFVLSEDLSEVQGLAQELQTSRSQLSLIMDAVPEMIWYKDKSNRIVKCNQAAAASKGLRVEEVEGRPASEIFPPARAEAYFREDLEILATGKPKRGIVESIVTPSGEERWVRTDKFPLVDGAGAPTGVVVFSIDITEQRRAERVLRENEQAQKDFVANVSHEFRTPLAAMMASAETLLNGGLKKPRTAVRFVAMIKRHAERLAWLVEQLLTLSTLESNLLLLHAEPLELEPYLNNVVAGLSPLLSAKKLTFRMELEAGLRARTDEKYLTQVLENLFSNAIKYNAQGGWIRVDGRRRDAQVELTVSDGGIGIPEKDLPFVFERFYRGSKTRKMSGHTGLGLHIARKIVEGLGGRIWVQSLEGRGSSFHLTLPAA